MSVLRLRGPFSLVGVPQLWPVLNLNRLVRSDPEALYMMLETDGSRESLFI